MKKFYITNSIAYTNTLPHLGFALEIIQADVIARYHRLLDKDVFFLTGTDEHGLKIAKAAKEAGKEPKDFVDEISKKFKALKTVLNLSNDDFIRTTDRKRHWPAVKKVWLKLKENDDIYKKKYKGLYCLNCEAFILEKDLVDGKCPVHQKKPEIVEEENYFFKLSKYSKEVERIIEKNEIKIIPKTRKNEILSFIKQGIEDISCSRLREKLRWGIPVPGDNTQTVYVWLEALVNYISALGYAEDSDKFKKFWPANVHCLGKDIFRFHSLLWPALLISLDLELPKTIFVHGFVTVAGQKMSKSLGNVIDPFELVKKYGTDPVRYYLLREIPSTGDGDFTYQKFETRYNSDLASGIGNLLARVRTMVDEIGFKENNLKSVEPKINEAWKNYKKSLEEFKFNEALKAIWDLISFSDKYIEKEKPWEKRENSPQALGCLLVILDNIAGLLKPFLPETSERISQEIERDKKSQKFKNKKGRPLFPRI